MTLKKNIESAEKSFRRNLMAIALPVALQNLMLALVGASDALMLGRLSQNAVSAVSLANQISFIMNLFIGSIVGGCSILVSQYYGKKDYGTIKKLMAMGIKLSGAVSLLFFAAAAFFPESLMRIYTQDSDLIVIGSGYLRIVSWSYLFAGLSQIYLMVMKIADRAVTSAAISVLTVVIDMTVDLFLIYGLAGAPRLGVAGCAISTVVVEASAFVVCVANSYRKKHIRPDRTSFFSFSKTLYKDLARVTMPSLASSLSWGVGYSMRSLIMGHLGNDAVAADSITALVLELATCFCKGFSSGASIMIGRLLGQNRMVEAESCAEKFWKISFLCGFVNIALLCAIGPVASIFFILTEEARSYLMQMMLIASVYLFAYSLNTIIACGVFPAGGDTIYDAKSVLISKWCFSLPLALLGAFLFHWPVMAVYIIVMSDEVVKVPWIYPRYKKYIWRKNVTRNNI